MKRLFILISIILVLSVNLFSQGFQYEWAIGIGGTNSDWGQSLAVDAAGNVYNTGSFYGTVDFDPGPGVFTLTSNGSNDIYISKYDSTGSFVWATHIGGGGNNAMSASICVDISGNGYLTGHFYDSIDFDPGPNVYNLFSEGISDIFLCKFDTDGNFIWANRFGGTSVDKGKSVFVDDAGYVYMTGFYNDTIDFDPGASTLILSSNGSADIFISKFNSTGNLVWAKGIGGNYIDEGNSLTVDNDGNVYTTGFFNETVDFDPGPGVFNMSYISFYPDIFISKLDSAGNFVWAKSFVGPDDGFSSWEGNCGNSIAVDAAGNVYTCGFFQNYVDFDPGPGVYDLSAIGGFDVFISKLDVSGNFAWAKSFGSWDMSNLSPDIAYSLALDNLGNVYTTGRFFWIADFDPGPGEYFLISNGGDIFISKLDSLGNFVSAISFGDGGSYNIGNSLALNQNENVFTTGLFSGVVDFNPGIGQSNLISNGSGDAFILKLGPCVHTYSSLVQSACVEYNLNGNIYTNSGIYQDTILSFLGCDSIVTLDLTIIPVEISVNQNGNTLTAQASGAVYQWIDCANGNVIIPGATNPSFTTTTNSNYAVIVTENGCTDTSLCFTISNIGINKNNQDFLFSVSPNPANERLVVQSSVDLLSIEIYSSYGQLLQTKKSNKTQEQVDISALPPGNYFIRAISREEVFVRKFVVVR